jgi:hypothetical protein
MFLREVKRQNRNGSQVPYLQLVHSDWDSAARTSRTKILYSFGRTDQVDTAAIERLIVSLARLLDPAAALKAIAGSDLRFLCSRPLGGTDVLDAQQVATTAATSCPQTPVRRAGPVNARATRVGNASGSPGEDHLSAAIRPGERTKARNGPKVAATRGLSSSAEMSEDGQSGNGGGRHQIMKTIWGFPRASKVWAGRSG